MNEEFSRLKTLLGEVIDIRRSLSVLSWDHETYMPPGGISARAEQLSTLSRIAHERFIADEIGELLESLSRNGFDVESDEACLARVAARDYARARKLPPDIVARIARETTLAHDVWVKARKEAQFSAFAPNLQTIVSLTIEVADLLGNGSNECRYDALLDGYEPEMRTSEVRRIFDQLKQEIIPLIQSISDKLDMVDDSCLHHEYDESKQLALGEDVARQFGFDFQRGRQDKSVHPFCCGIAPGDVRITTRVNRTNLAMALFGTMHETGHGLYEQGLPTEWDRSPLCDGASLGIHESQSRLWENIVGRSRPFWRYFYPKLRDAFPGVASDDDAEAFFRAANKVKPSFIRVEADELTYNLHILLRFELENDLLDERLRVVDLPKAWNEKMREYLGIVPPDDAQGVLQDIHWSGGSIGYFPTYTLGNLVAAQLHERIAEDLPDVDSELEQGRFNDLLAWLRENIHRHGRRYPPADLVLKTTGKPMSADAFIRYAKKKFADIYSL